MLLNDVRRIKNPIM